MPSAWRPVDPPESPRLPLTPSTSKIPRRRPSATLVSDPAPISSAPPSPEKRRRSTGDKGASVALPQPDASVESKHARRPSRTQFLPPPQSTACSAESAPQPSLSAGPPALDHPAPMDINTAIPTSLLERRRSSAGQSPAGSGSGTSTSSRPDMRRTPSLSISIPSTSGAVPSRPRPAPPPPPQHVTLALDPARRPPRRLGHSRNPSRDSPLSSTPAENYIGERDGGTGPLSPGKPRPAGAASKSRRCSGPLAHAHHHHHHHGAVAGGGGISPAFRAPRTPYPFGTNGSAAGAGSVPNSAGPTVPGTPRFWTSQRHSSQHQHSQPGAMLERTLSESTMATYTSFDLQHPRTPDEDPASAAGGEGAGVGAGDGAWRGVGTRAKRWWRGWFGLGGGGRRGRCEPDADLEYGDGYGSGVGAGAAGGGIAAEGQKQQQQQQHRPSLPAVDERSPLLASPFRDRDLVRPPETAVTAQTRWQYVWSETKCYAKHMLPPILVFVVLVLVIALLAYQQAVRRIARPPSS